MAKGYWIAHVKVTDPERYKDYVAANAIAFEKYNAKFLTRGGSHTMFEGPRENRSCVPVEFPSMEKASAFLELAGISGADSQPRRSR